jgi:hypothetical protein
MNSEQTMIRLIEHPDKPVTFMFEDDGKTGYAYLIDSKIRKVIADVWLYNRHSTPNAPEWTTREGAPYRNSTAYSDPHADFEFPTNESDIDIRWVEDESARVGSIVLLRNEPVAELYVGDMPGKSKFARMDGPLARKFDNHRN